MAQPVQHPIYPNYGFCLGDIQRIDVAFNKVLKSIGGKIGGMSDASLSRPSYNVDMQKKSKKQSKKVKGQFLSQELDRDELKKAKDLADKIIKRNKRLGDLLGQ